MTPEQIESKRKELRGELGYFGIIRETDPLYKVETALIQCNEKLDRARALSEDEKKLSSCFLKDLNDGRVELNKAREQIQELTKEKDEAMERVRYLEEAYADVNLERKDQD